MIYFITENWIKTRTPITKNIDVSEITPWIQVNAENWVKNIIGTYFFNDLLAKFNSQSLNSNETEIVELLKPAIAWRATSDAVFALSFQLKNKGIQTQSGDYSAAAALNEVQFTMSHYADKAVIYEDAIYKYLAKKENADLFPFFTSSLNNDSSAKKCNGNNSHNVTIMII